MGWFPLGASASDLNIAFIGTLTGPYAHRGQDQLDGFQLAVKQLGGRLGGMEFAFSAFDDHRDPKLALQALDRLSQGPHVTVLLLSSSEKVASVLAPRLAAQHSIVILLDQPPSHLAGHDCNPYLFSLAGLSDTQLAVSGQYLQSQHFAKVAVIEPDSPAAREALAVLRRDFRGQLVEIPVPRGRMNFSQTIAAIRDSAPDALYLLLEGGMAVNFVLQYADSRPASDPDGHLPPGPPLIGPAGVIGRSLLADAGPALADSVSLGDWTDDLDSPGNRKMLADFEATYSRQPSALAAVGFDAGLLLDAAFKALAPKPTDTLPKDDESMRGALHQVDFSGTRPGFRFDSNQFPVETYYLRRAVEDSRSRMINEQRGIFLKDVRDDRVEQCPMRGSPPKH